MRVMLVANYQVEYSVQLANALSKTVDLALVVWDGLAPESVKLVEPSVTLHRLGKPGSGWISKLRGQMDVVSISRRFRPEVIHFQNAYTWQTPFLPLTSGDRWIVSIHDPIPHAGNPDVFSFPSIAAQTTRANAFVVMGNVQREQFLSRFSVDPDRVWVIPHGEFSYYSRSPAAVSGHGENILFIGRIAPYKGLDFFLKAAELVNKTTPGLHFRIVGAGNLSRYAGLMARLPNLSVINGDLSLSCIAQEIRDAAVVVAPYTEASQSGVVIAAESLGRPVVASRVGGLTEDVRDGQTGLLVEPRNPEKLAEAISFLLSHPQIRREMGNHAEQFMRTERSWDNIARLTTQMYEAIS